MVGPPIASGGLGPAAPGGRVAPPGIFAIGTVGGKDGGGTPGGRGGPPAGALGARGMAGAEGRGTWEVGVRVAGAGSGALGSWMGAVDLLAPPPARPTGEVGTRAVAAPAGVTEVVIGCGVEPKPVIGAVCSFGCVTPMPGRARKVMRTVSFLSGTAEVFAFGTGGGVGWVLFSSLMMGSEFPQAKRKNSRLSNGFSCRPSIAFSCVMWKSSCLTQPGTEPTDSSHRPPA